MLSREDRWEILPLQNCILNIMDYIDRFCSQHGIRYYLMGGSALGAVRHKGFIPWDDDLDIFMTLDEYERFRNAFRCKGDRDAFYLQEAGRSGDMITRAKVRMNNTYLIEDVVKTRDIHHGIFVDIFILHNCPASRPKRYWQYLWARYIVAKALANRHYNRGSLLRQGVIALFKLLPKRFLLRFALRQVYRYRHTPSPDYCHFFGRATIKKAVYPKSLFGNPRRVPFETLSLCVPERVEEYLSMRWGDYMKLPSEDEIRHFQHASDWSLDQSAPPRKGGTFSDEKYLF